MNLVHTAGADHRPLCGAPGPCAPHDPKPLTLLFQCQACFHLLRQR